VQWLPHPLCKVDVIFEYVGPKDIATLLHSIWNFICEYPPSESLYEEVEKHTWKRKFPENMDLGKAWFIVKTILQDNITKTALLYPIFFSKKK
jgi:hypothetical protein